VGLGFLKSIGKGALEIAVQVAPLPDVVKNKVAQGLAGESRVSVHLVVIDILSDLKHVYDIYQMANADGKLSELELKILMDAIGEPLEKAKSLIAQYE
jgi:hypothetical protein